MKKTATTLLLFTGIFMSVAQTHLFRIVTNGKTGYMDAGGKTIIEPKYHNGTDFFGEYAAVRENGLYGIINTKGEYVLKPSYPIIYEGEENYTVARTKNKKILIDLSGKIKFDADVTEYKVQPDYLFVYTEKAGTYVFDRKTGTQVLYSKYYLKTPYKGVCTAINYDRNGRKESYVTDLKGNIIVPENKYVAIDDFKDDVACVKIDSVTYGAIDLAGKLLFKTEYELIDYNAEGFSEGYAIVELRRAKPNEDDWNTRYYGYIDKTGKLVYSDTAISLAHPFVNGRAMVELNGGEDRILDKNFKEINPDIEEPLFRKEYNLVQAEHGWIIFDKSGNKILATEEDLEHVQDPVLGNFLFYSKEIEGKTFKGFINLKTKQNSGAVIEEYDFRGFKDGLLAATVNKKWVYIDENGKIVWQQSDDSTLKSLNIDYMLRGNFRAYDKTTKKHNGWATSDNFPIKNKVGIFKPKQLSVVIDTTASNNFYNLYKGYSVYVANTTSKKIPFTASDSMLEMVVQAKDETGKWKDITYTPRSWCGNSYHTLHLPKNEHWEFSLPVFDGGFETEIRVKLIPEYKKKEYYSNSIKARVNPGQFFYKQPYYGQGIMDPYNE